MSILETINLIFQAYSYFKDTYRTLRENEELLRDVFDEIFLYEALIQLYSQKIREEQIPSQSAFVAPVQKFAAGVVGFQKLISQNTHEKGGMAKAWKYCRSWCCTQQNSSRIKKHAEV
jgi:hypothetical protein